jgi:lipopolysaccharide transport system ATP-binding protein
MSDIAVSVRNLSKCFTIDHERGRLGGYQTLHDELTGLPRRLFRRLRGDGRPTSETFWALHDVSFDINRGEVVGIIGGNGAGKSTLLKILNRITEPTTGGADIYGRVGALLEIGTGFHPELTGRENVFLNGAILGMTRAEIRRKFDEIVAFAEIEKFLDTPVKRYSSGMYVRLAFAVAAHLDPEILLIDEVLAVGDAEFQRKCLTKMEDIAAKEGRTVIFVSHDMDAICQLCSRCFLLRHGELEKSGETAEIVATYLGAGGRETPIVKFQPRPSEAILRSAGLYAPNGKSTVSFDSSVPLEVRCSFSVHQLIKGLQFSLSVLNFKLEKIFYSSVSMANPPISIETPGEYNIAAVIPARFLLPGRYFVNFALHTPKTHLYDLREQALGFRINVPADAHHGLGSDEVGQVYADIKWRRTEDQAATSRQETQPLLTAAETHS